MQESSVCGTKLGRVARKSCFLALGFEVAGPAQFNRFNRRRCGENRKTRKGEALSSRSRMKLLVRISLVAAIALKSDVALGGEIHQGLYFGGSGYLVQPFGKSLYLGERLTLG